LKHLPLPEIGFLNPERLMDLEDENYVCNRKPSSMRVELPLILCNLQLINTAKHGKVGG